MRTDSLSFVSWIEYICKEQMGFSDPPLFFLTSLIHSASFILGWMSLQSSTLSLSVSCFWSPACVFYVSALILAHMRTVESQFTHCKTDYSNQEGGLVSADETYTVGLHTKKCRYVLHHVSKL